MKIIRTTWKVARKYMFVVAIGIAVIMVGATLYKDSDFSNQELGSSAEHFDNINVVKTKPTPASIPKTVPLQKTKPVQKIVNSNTTESCPFPHSGTITVPKGDCAKMTDCEISTGKWRAVWVTDCDALHKKNVKEKVAGATDTVKKDSAEKLIDCIFDSPWGNSQEYLQVTEEYCQERISSWSKYKPAPKSTYEYEPYEPPKTVECVLSYGTFNLEEGYCREQQAKDTYDQDTRELELQFRDACNDILVEWQAEKASFYANDYYDYSSSADAVRALYARQQALQAEVDSIGCNIRIPQ